MNIPQSLLAFSAAAALLTITPGLDTAMVLRAATLEGPRRGMLAALGVALGCLIWGSAVSLGLGALLEASHLAYTILKWVGAAYLAWVGARLLLWPRSRLADASGGAPGRNGGDPFRRGLLTNLLNPKVGVFYVTFLPQFIPAHVNVAAWSFLLACIHVVMGPIWFAILIAALAPLSRFLTRPRVVQTLDRVTGCVFLAFGVRLALAERS